ncbi:hypothetical protein M422DRAFT_259513 [Sphaerobolus stellatus SS14]|uniref:Uncharacterized protein n=1 Tax=Sphaerobolus stellatus (strain SS14) TaxID=990650 RepID=A0A0C9V8R7_SPHS4|nr:hypothetical protein M422DRAFT_259513 [Sphaerobolus stellatus SS14]
MKGNSNFGATLSTNYCRRKHEKLQPTFSRCILSPSDSHCKDPEALSFRSYSRNITAGAVPRQVKFIPLRPRSAPYITVVPGILTGENLGNRNALADKEVVRDDFSLSVSCPLLHHAPLDHATTMVIMSVTLYTVGQPHSDVSIPLVFQFSTQAWKMGVEHCHLTKTYAVQSPLNDIHVDFRSETSIPPPDPRYLAIHAAFAKVFKAAGADEYINKYFWDHDQMGVFASDGSTDVSPCYRNFTKLYTIHEYVIYFIKSIPLQNL